MIISPHAWGWLGRHDDGTRFRPWCWCDPPVAFFIDDDGEPSTLFIHADFQAVAFATRGRPPV